ncbi:MAG: HDOD domain-containing protein [Methylococcaceae bacterium]|nr:HDOD domain-containing protein [Methylococcaceae bacterium]
MKLESEEDLLEYILTEIKANRLVLPTLPDVALKVRQTISKGDVSANQIAEIIATDTALSARLIQIANSPLYRGRQQIEKLQIAVARLGNTTVRTLVTSLVMQQVFKPGSKSLEQNFRGIWEQSVNVSAIARALTSQCKHLDPDQAMLAGLIHQIGKLPILILASKTEGLLEDPNRFRWMLENLHPLIGKMIMDAWDFPKSLRPVASEYRNFKRDVSPTADYVDVVQVAYIQNLIDSKAERDGLDFSKVPAFAKLGLSPDIEVLEIDGISDEIAQTHALFA